MEKKLNPFKGLAESIKQNRKGLFRLWLILSAVHLISLTLGIAIFFIVFGTQIALRRIIIYWTPARNWLVNQFDLTIAEPDNPKVSPLYKWSVNIYHFVITLVFVVIGLYVVRLGVNILLRDGFLGQNFIYLIFFRQ
jgi:hypothetical protein